MFKGDILFNLEIINKKVLYLQEKLESNVKVSVTLVASIYQDIYVLQNAILASGIKDA